MNVDSVTSACFSVRVFTGSHNDSDGRKVMTSSATIIAAKKGSMERVALGQHERDLRHLSYSAMERSAAPPPSVDARFSRV
jgi:hypothetical protein